MENMVQIQAHRGASGIAPENTLAAFREAVYVGADGIECDIHATKDGVYVVCHDGEIDRTSNGHGRIGEYTLEELRRFDFGGWKDPRFAGEQIPTLEEVLAVVKDLPVINIEVKDLRENTPEDLEAFYRILEKKGVLRRVLISSFQLEILERLKRQYPILHTAYLYVDAADTGAMDAAAAAGCSAVHPSHANLTAELAARAHRLGMAVNTWTVDDPNRMQTLAGFGCDGLITNRPEIARQVFGRPA